MALVICSKPHLTKPRIILSTVNWVHNIGHTKLVFRSSRTYFSWKMPRFLNKKTDHLHVYFSLTNRLVAVSLPSNPWSICTKLHFTLTKLNLSAPDCTSSKPYWIYLLQTAFHLDQIESFCSRLHFIWTKLNLSAPNCISPRPKWSCPYNGRVLVRCQTASYQKMVRYLSAINNLLRLLEEQ